MNRRLYNDNGCETLTQLGSDWSGAIRKFLEAIVQTAINSNISLRDLNTLVCEEINLMTAEERLRKGVQERKASRVA